MSDELYGLRISDEYLAHHGILGQKWGKKNGPPYPLDYRKLSAEEKQLAKADAIRRGDLDEVKFNRNEFTDDEVRAAINRFKINSELSALSEKHVKSGMDKVAELTNKVHQAAIIVDKGTDAWNVFAKVSNSLGLTKPKDLPIIDKRDPWNKPSPKQPVVNKSIVVGPDGKAVMTRREVIDPNGNKTTYSYNSSKDNSSASNMSTKERIKQVKQDAKVQKAMDKEVAKINANREKLNSKYRSSDVNKQYQEETAKKNAKKLHASGFGITPKAYNANW